MEENIMDCGKIIKWKEMGFSLGQMEENIKVNIMMIKKRDKVFSIGQTDVNTMEGGKTVNNMVMEHIHLPVEKLNKASGMKERGLIGSHNENISI